VSGQTISITGDQSQQDIHHQLLVTGSTSQQGLR